MGKFFVMSKRFNKQSALDFGLSDKGCGMAVNPDDGSLWKKDTLFDFGWGPENGYYRVPLPDFPHLLDIILLEDNDEDILERLQLLRDSILKSSWNTARI